MSNLANINFSYKQKMFAFCSLLISEEYKILINFPQKVFIILHIRNMLLEFKY